MEKEQELEWAEAQKIIISKDLVAAAKQQLKFLAAVDRNRHLYDGPALDQAIYRYKYCWLPLLAKYGDSQVSEGPLVVPLDCEWVWHCHRLNPVRYKADCKELYGRILDNRNVVSSVHGTCQKRTEVIWNNMFPSEPYELKMSTRLENVDENTMEARKTTMYDLVSAVKRQSPFFYQVSRSHMCDDLFLEEAVARYKGFLHLIKRNRERSIRRFCVPTYDIDLIWHSHQLHPVSYTKDLVAVIGRTLEHDDTDSDRTKGKKLDIGFSGTTKQWEETFGSRYWKAGAMCRGNAPSPLKINLSQLDSVSKKGVLSNELQNTIQLPKKMLVEVMLEIVGVRNLPARHKGSLFVTFSKKQPDMLFNTKRRTSILSETGEQDVAVFQCEPTGELVFELMSYSASTLPIARPAKMLGTTSVSLQDLVNPASQLSAEKWFELVPSSGDVGSKPINLCIAISFTPPVPASYELHMVRTRPFSSSCFFPLPGRFQHAKSTFVADEAGNEIISIQMRDLMNVEAKNNGLSQKEVIGITTSGETHVLAEFGQTGWSLMNSNGLFQLQEKFSEWGRIFELTGSRKVIIFPGRKLEYETKTCENLKYEQHFMTAVEFSAEYPNGKAAALLNLKSGSLKIDEEWLVLPGIVMAFLLSDISREDSYSGLTSNGENVREMDNTLKDVSERVAEGTEVMPKMDCKCNDGALVYCSHGECVAGCGAVDEVNDDGVLVNSGQCTECAGCSGTDELKVAAKGTDVKPKKDGTFNGKHDNEGVTGGCGGSCGGGGCKIGGGCGGCSGGCGGGGCKIGGGCGGGCGGGGRKIGGGSGFIFVEATLSDTPTNAKQAVIT